MAGPTGGRGWEVDMQRPDIGMMQATGRTVRRVAAGGDVRRGKK